MMSPTPSLFLCSHFARVVSLLPDSVEGARVVFIPTAARRESYTAYVDAARDAWRNSGAEMHEVDVSAVDRASAEAAVDAADIIYVSGGNSYFLIDQLRGSGLGEVLKNRVRAGALYVGESAGAVACAPDISYIEPMDCVPNDFSQQDGAGLGLTNFYVVPHYQSEPFSWAADTILEKNADLPLKPLTNSEALLVRGIEVRRLSVPAGE
ncbi:Type 1 glutamine amidotransferase-like domain-containing protein [Corynebacterium mastitidis]|uniref:Type 1 glutamine amidotransferase-like domain-containing protein n=1 Tax=Corynebacterium mastitidis TaxID=161890 RepID=UPI00254D6BEA|nr:Type 1 glutamine amidotransferase-like domain-containing protein [Corynebacterium mastitidis]MDK8451421.1 Type 1 glutamine amidotransferase-like domain-containing protein [Corynebacterium mastitidis]